MVDFQMFRMFLSSISIESYMYNIEQIYNL